MNKKVQKALLAALSLGLVAVMAVAGTMAYLQDESEVVNTFSANNVNVDLTETGDQQYNIIPGTSEEKDPTVTVDASLPSYVYLVVTDTTYGLVDYEIADGWTLLDGYHNVYYREFEPTTENTIASYSVLKDNKVSYSADLTNEEMKKALEKAEEAGTKLELGFKAYAIQKEPFDSSLLAYGGATGTVVSSSEEITNAIAAANQAGEPVTLLLTEADSINLESTLTITAEHGLTLIGDGVTITGKPITINAKDDVVITGVNFNNGTEDTESSIYITNKAEIESLLIENCSFKDAAWDAIQLTNPNIGSIVIRNNTFENTKQGYRFIHLEARSAVNSSLYTTSNAKVVITGNTFTNVSNSYCKDSAITVCGFYFDNMTINANTVMGDGADSLTSSIIWICNGTNFRSLYTEDQIKAAFVFNSTGTGAQNTPDVDNP